MKNGIAKTLAVVAAAGSLAACGSRFEEHETGFRIGGDGAIKEHIVGPEWVCFMICDPFASDVKYSTFVDTFTISSGEGANAGGQSGGQTPQQREIFLRTADDKFLDSVSLAISAEVDADATLENLNGLRTTFKATSSDPETNSALIRDDLQILAIQPLVSAIRNINALEISEQGEELGNTIAAALQLEINNRLEIEEGEVPPVRVRDVRIAGTKFDPDTEALLRQRALAPERAEIARIAQQAAEAQRESAAAQSQVMAGMFSTMTNAGVPDNQVATAVCLDGVRQQILPQDTNCFPGIVLDR